MQAGLEVASAVTAGGALGARVPSGRLPAAPPEPIAPPSKRALGVRSKRRLPGAFGFLARGRPVNLPANHVQFVRNRGR